MVNAGKLKLKLTANGLDRQILQPIGCKVKGFLSICFLFGGQA